MAAKKPSKRAARKSAKSAAPPPHPSDAAEADSEKAPSGHHYEPGFPVVGMGASAGGLEAFKRFFSAMPANNGMAFVVVPHLDPKQKSLMVELLARHTAMKVCEVTEATQLEREHVYVIPPNHFLAVEHGQLHLTAPRETRGATVAIDACFRSLAADQADWAAGIILSGTGSHGVSGLKEIKLAGGLIMAQQPATAEFEQMPSSAIATGIVDYILPPEEMPAALIKFFEHAKPANGAAASVAEQESPQLLAAILGLLRSRTKYDFSCYRKNMLLRRIERRMGLCGIFGLSAYVDFLRSHSQEVIALRKDLLIGVTAFFREPESFQTLDQLVIHELIGRMRDDVPLRVWVPACATGEEAYSIAMLLIEGCATAKQTPNFQIFATDVDEDALDFARRGLYPASIADDLSRQRLQRFFVPADENHYQINKQLRESILFAPQNLTVDPPFSRQDFVSCRNLLIYLEPEVQHKVITLFHFALKEGGYLVLGPSETIGRDTDLFETISKKWRVFRRIGPARRDRLEIPNFAGERPRLQFVRREPVARNPAGFSQLMQKLLVQEYAPASVLINRAFEVFCLHGATSNYLEFPSGEPSKDLLALARPGLPMKIRSAVNYAVREGQSVADETARVKRNGTHVPCTITVKPLQNAKDAEGLLLVTFQDRGVAEAATGPATHPAEPLEEQPSVVKLLEDELRTTREELQSTIEELEGSNEELKASQEELMSMNEELQSANEELETSKEELQSFNEELTTVNSQLEEKIMQLESATNDMTNLLASSEIAVVFLDAELCIKRFTPPTAKLLNLLKSDLGRPFRDISPKFTDPHLLDDCHLVLENVIPDEKEVWTEVKHHPSKRGDAAEYRRRWYLRRVLPYRASDQCIDGVVITLVDITDRMEREAQTRRLLTVLRDSNDGVTVQDMDGRITDWNRGAARMYGYSEAEALAMNIRELIPPNGQAAYLDRIRQIAQGQPTDPFDIQILTKDGRLLDVWLTATPLLDENGGVVGLATTERDITDRKKTEQELRQLNQELEQRVAGRTAQLTAANEKLTAEIVERKLAETALRENEERLAAIVKTAADAIITIRDDGTIESFNPAAQRMFGHSAQEAIGQPVNILVPSAYREERGDFLSYFLQIGQPGTVEVGHELMGLRKQGKVFPIDLAVSEVREGSQRLFTGIIRDISERKELQKQVLQIAEDEQRRIGQDLHDNTQQELTGLGMIAHGLFETLSTKGLNEAKMAARLSEGIGRALENVRKLSRGLVPAEVSAHGLTLALADLAKRSGELQPIRFTFQCDETVEVKDDIVATHLYRIAQEAITNALKHAQTDHITLSLAKTDGQITLEVHDNGRGIDPSQTGSSGIGLQVMAFRAGLIGGSLRVNPAAQGGTLVTCKVSS